MSVAASLTLTGCFSDNDNNVKVDPPTPPTPTPTETVVPDTLVTEQPSKVFSVNVVNAANSDVLSGATVSFVVNGEPANVLTDVNGEDLSSVTVDETGNFTFLNKEGETGSVTALVASEGYISKSFTVDLSAEVEGDANDIPLEFGLVSAAATEGVEVAEEKAAVTGGTTAEAVTAAASGEGANAELTVPANTEFQNAAGEAISGSEVTMSVIAADSSNANTGAIIPAGLNDGSTTQVKKPVGVTSITMTDDTGAKIKKFSSPINVSVAIPSGNDIKVGDQLDISSYDEDTGVWSEETNKATVVSNGGALSAQFATDHLTFFSMNKSVPICTDGVTVRVVGGTLPARGLAVSMTSPDGSISSYLRSNSKQVISGASTARFGISSEAVAKVRLYDRAGNTWYEQENQGICGNVDVTLTNSVQTIEKEVTLSGVCAADETKTADLSGSIVTYAKDGKAASLAQALGNSTFKLSGIEVGGNYTVRATIRGAKVQGGGQSQVFTFGNVQSADTLTGSVQLECNQVPVTGG